ncbi:MAG: hypothetical protein JXJ30_00810 [Halothiobacillaceae bacterium]|nr:hypothetical protein [Halothiobacillaceae bacterium]
MRRALHASGFRFRLGRRDLVGRPDIVLPKCNLVVFGYGYFWQRHEECKFTTTPRSRVEFWDDKFASDMERDAGNEGPLIQSGW